MRIFPPGGNRATPIDPLCRALDLSGAALAILFALPLIAFLSLMIVCEGPGRPVFVRYRRVRADGSHFDLIKFRTQRYAHMTATGHVGVDSRPSRLGGVLRTTGLDELPMLINIFKGELPVCGRYTWRQVIAWLGDGHPKDGMNVG